MNANIFSGKDYFNYYFAGIAWIISLVIITTKIPLDLTKIIEFISKVPSIIMAIILLIIPFLLGFILSPACYLITACLKKIFGDPANWVLVLEKQKYSETKKCFRKRISEPLRTKILKKLSLLQEGTTNFSPYYFVRNYVEIKAKDNIRSLLNRSLDMANLTESLLIPIPLLGFLIGRIFFTVVSSVFICLFLFLLLSYRYFQLREYWVKHNYRTFAIID